MLCELVVKRGKKSQKHGQKGKVMTCFAYFPFFFFSCGHISPPSAHFIMSATHVMLRTTVALAVLVYWEDRCWGCGLGIDGIVNTGV